MIVYSIAFSFTTGSAPGKPKQTGQVWVFGSAPKIVLQPQNIFEAVPNSTWTSKPSTGSYFSITSSYFKLMRALLNQKRAKELERPIYLTAQFLAQPLRYKADHLS